MAPRAIQEALKRLSEGFHVEDAIRNPFWTRFKCQNGALGPQKSLKSCVLSSKIKVSQFSARVASGTRFGDLPGSVLVPCWPSRCLQDHLKSAQDTPKTAQEASKTAPRAPKRPPRPLQEASKTAPGGLQEAKRLQEVSRESFRTPFASIFDPIWTQKASPHNSANNCLCLSVTRPRAVTSSPRIL